MGLGGAGVLGRDDQRREPAEGRQAGALAQRRLLLVEALGLAAEQRANDRMIGLPALDQRAARLVAAAGAAGHLSEQLKSALGGARIGAAEPGIGVDDADQGQKGKIMALGDELRADDDIEGAGGDLGELAPQPLLPAGKIRGQYQHARIREQDRRLLGEPLDARPAGGERVLRLAFRAIGRAPLDMAAMMADQRAAEAMLDQPGVAIGTAEAMAAAAAQRQGRIAAPIEEEQRLLAARDGLGRLRRQTRRDPAPALRALVAHVDRLDARHRAARRRGRRGADAHSARSRR